MQRQSGSVAAAKPDISVEKFKERLESVKKGIRFVWTLNTEDFEKFKVGPTERKQWRRVYDRPIDSSPPIKIVEKFQRLKFDIDLTNGQVLPRLLVRTNPAWDPSPRSMELVQGPAGEPHRKDVILYQQLQVTRTRNTAPFGLGFYSSLHQYFTNLVTAVAAKTRDSEVVMPTFKLELDPLQTAIALMPNTPDWVELKEAEGQTTRYLPLMQPEMSMATYYSAQVECLDNGTTNITMPHPVTNVPTEYVMMSYSHILFQEVKENWKEWKVQISPLNGARTKIHQDYTVLMEKRLVEDVKLWCRENLPPQTSVVPADKISFAIGRQYQKARKNESHPGGLVWDWRSRKNCNPANANLDQKFECEVEIKLVYGLLPLQLGKRPLLLVRQLQVKTARGEKLMVGFDNRQDLDLALREEVADQIKMEEIPFNFMDLEAGPEDEEEEEKNEEKANDVEPELRSMKVDVNQDAMQEG